MITVNCQSSIKITGPKTVYFDPLKVPETHDADMILITHPHWDHFSEEDIEKVKNKNTIIIGPQDIREASLKMNFEQNQIITILPGEQIEIEGIKIHTVPSYNVNKKFHPRENNWLGYVVEIENITYYIMGDTDALEENRQISCDILCIPIGGTYTMNAQEAARFTNELKPKIAIPIHYGMVVGSKEDFDIWKSLVDKEITIEEKIQL